MLKQAGSGDEHARDKLIDLIHHDLYRIASRQMRPGESITLQVHGLINEAFIELFGKPRKQFSDRNHFFAYAATVMRHILVGEARKRNSLKRGGGQLRVTLAGLPGEQTEDDILALDEALDNLARIDPRKSKLVELRYFGGLKIDEICDFEGLSSATVYKELKAARGWLYHSLHE